MLPRPQVKVMTATPDTSRRASPLENDPRSDELSANATVPEAACTDPADLARLVIEGLFGLILSDPHASQRLGLKAMARCDKESTAWYFWTTSRLGAFEAAPRPASPEAEPDSIVLALRYFPDPREAVFTRFAPVEQRARLSSRFDSAGVPGPDSAGQVDSGLFHLGCLRIEPQGANHVGLCLSAQDRCIEYVRGDGQWQACRDVPGLRLALTVLDPLVCALSYLGRQPPALVRAWRRSSLASYIEADAGSSIRPEPSASTWEIELRGLVIPGHAGSAVPAQGATRALEQPVFEYAAEIPPHYAPWPVTPQWWQAAGWQFNAVVESGSQATMPARERGDAAAHTFSGAGDDEHKF